MPRRKRTVPGIAVRLMTLAVLVANLIKGPGSTPAALTLYDALLIGCGASFGLAIAEAVIRQQIRQHLRDQAGRHGQ